MGSSVIRGGKAAWRWLPGPVRRPVLVGVQTIRLYSADDCGIYAAAIAYYALFSLVPIALITLSVFGIVIDRDEIVDFVFEQLPLEQTDDVRDNVDELVRRSSQLSGAGISVGVLVLLWSGSGLFSAIRRGLNATRHQRESRPFWQGKLIDLALVLGVGTLITLSIGMTAITRIATERAGDLGVIEINLNQTLELTTYVLSAIVSFIMFALLYRLVPTPRPRWNEALYGALLATVLFEATKNLGAFLIQTQSFTRDTALYAGVGSVFIFLIWVFVNGSILLLGAEFARVVAGPEPGPTTTPVPLSQPRPMFWRRFRGPHRASPDTTDVS
ncbi:MAG TPA: YihY/virulence factor BrkB family protein [Tepidiformaceae bacterium]|nr:YihY/virulence factor BrkB family protein [Tepidiformaceae bacterium]